MRKEKNEQSLNKNYIIKGNEKRNEYLFIIIWYVM